jgi:hypothetical protein
LTTTEDVTAALHAAIPEAPVPHPLAAGNHVLVAITGTAPALRFWQPLEFITVGELRQLIANTESDDREIRIQIGYEFYDASRRLPEICACDEPNEKRLTAYDLAFEIGWHNCQNQDFVAFRLLSDSSPKISS